MNHQNFQEAIAQLSTSEGLESEAIKSQFNLNEEDMRAMQSHNSLIQTVVPRPGLCCCCVQCDS